MRSVFSICPCIQLHKYACNVSEIWFFACSSRVNIWEPAFCCTVTLLLAVNGVGLPSFLIPTAMSDSQSLNTSMLEVLISSKNESVFIWELGDTTLQSVFNGWWASMNVGSKRSLAWNSSRHVPLWRFYLHCGIEETSSPGIVYIVCHQVLRHPSEHGTRSMGKNLLAKAHITKLNKLRESEVSELTSSTGDETVFAILKRQRSWGITMLSSQRKFIFDIKVDPYRPKWQTKRCKLAAKDFEASNFHQYTCHRYLILRFVLSHIPSKIYRFSSYDSHIWHYESTLCFLAPPRLATFAGRNMHWPWMQSKSNTQLKIKLV